MLRRSFLGSLSLLAPLTGLAAGRKPTLTGLAAVEQTLRDAHGKQLKDIPWLVWHVQTVSRIHNVWGPDDGRLDRTEERVVHHTFRHVNWAMSLGQMMTQFGLDPDLYSVECTAGAAQDTAFTAGQNPEAYFLFQKIWLRADWDRVHAHAWRHSLNFGYTPGKLAMINNRDWSLGTP